MNYIYSSWVFFISWFENFNFISSEEIFICAWNSNLIWCIWLLCSSSNSYSFYLKIYKKTKLKYITYWILLLLLLFNIFKIFRRHHFNLPDFTFFWVDFFIWIIHILFDCKFSDDFFQQNENLNSRRLFLLFSKKNCVGLPCHLFVLF